jgi:NAD(P)-dependent dehydrogenase (short-subunit alcohol dehydrogenase family)
MLGYPVARLVTLMGWKAGSGVTAVNQTSVFLGTKLAAEQMAKTSGGSIVNISSNHGLCRRRQRPSRLQRFEGRGADLREVGGRCAAGRGSG